MVHKEVKKVLIDKNMTIAELARKMGYTRVQVSRIINGHVESPKAERLIAFVLNIPRSQLFKRNSS